MADRIQTRTFRNEDTIEVARALIGKFLAVAAPDGAVLRRRITETEAYHGESDLACHASRGRTARTEVLYAAGGVWYVYLCYGVHEMLNLVTGPRDRPAAVLIRGVEGLTGPGRVTRQLGIDRRFNARPAVPAEGLWLEDDGFEPPARSVRATPRIGIDYAGLPWTRKKWRFVWSGGDLPGTIPSPTQRRGGAE